MPGQQPTTRPAFVEVPLTPTEQQAAFQEVPIPAPRATRPATPNDLLGSFSTGIGKGATQTALGLVKLLTKVTGVADVVDRYYGQPGLTAKKMAELDEQLKAENPAETAGKVVEQTAELMAPIGATGTAAKLTTGLPRAARFGAKMLAGAGEFAGKTAVQTGGDPEAMTTAALLGGASPLVGKALSGTGGVVFEKFPERLYGQVFKIAEDDLRAAYQTVARGQALNPTLAKEMLERGLFGSSRNMAVYSFKKLDALEGQLQATLTGKRVTLPQKNDYLNLLRSLDDEFGGAFAKMGKEAGKLAFELNAVEGASIPAPLALRLKRLLDRARSTTSFRESVRLGPKQDDYKEAADLVRRTIHQTFPDASSLLNEERVFIQASDAIVKDAVARNNRRLLGLTDYILGGGGMASGFGASGIGAAAAVRGFQNPFTLTGLGQTLRRLGLGLPPGEGIAKGAAAVSAQASRD